VCFAAACGGAAPAPEQRQRQRQRQRQGMGGRRCRGRRAPHPRMHQVVVQQQQQQGGARGTGDARALETTGAAMVQAAGLGPGLQLLPVMLQAAVLLLQPPPLPPLVRLGQWRGYGPGMPRGHLEGWAWW
jgi:hypothetical protein